MTSRISYMGTKHELAPAVLAVIQTCQPGRVLDAFAGMGAVAASLAGKRQVWTNDVQHFAHLASACRIADPVGPASTRVLSRLAEPLYSENLRKLHDQNSDALRLERKALRGTDFTAFRIPFDRACAMSVRTDEAYGCIAKTYSYGYFSLEQCAQIDSIRYALEVLRGRGSISDRKFDWGILALGGAAIRVANTTGHFAQFLTPNPSNYERVAKQFRRSAWTEWLKCASRLKPIGTAKWRGENLATRSDSTSLLSNRDYASKAQVVYCDPPYTDDQYSRYYHVWETLVLYDYPEITGRGRYREGRFTTDFSLASKVKSAFERLIKEVASSGADFVLSYPSNGLLHHAGQCPLEMLKAEYPSAELAVEVPYSHSTMGASKGSAKSAVTERVYLARA